MNNIYSNSFKMVLLMQLGVAFATLLFSCSADPASETSTTPPVVTIPPIKQSTFVSAAEIVDLMGTGFNLGNTFDYNLQSTTPTSIYPIIDMYYNAGMRHIRVPVTWMDGFGGNHLADAGGSCY